MKHELAMSRAKRKHALAGSGPIVDRARAGLRRVSEQFGEPTRTTDTAVEVTTAEGLDLILSYQPGNYLFSRVYNLTISTVLPTASPVPTDIKVSFRGPNSPRFIPGSGFSQGPELDRLNEVVSPQLAEIDLVSSAVVAKGSGNVLSVTPMGGSFVWILIPPVFKATAFPAGETDRIIRLCHTFKSFTY